jgi:uncharacterized membrane protein YraQ (UPF0718 family)
MYFPNMTEAAFADIMKIRMNGPTLALVLNATGTSSSWLVICKIFGVRMSVVYGALVILLGTVAGLIGENLFSMA